MQTRGRTLPAPSRSPFGHEDARPRGRPTWEGSGKQAGCFNLTCPFPEAPRPQHEQRPTPGGRPAWPVTGPSRAPELAGPPTQAVPESSKPFTGGQGRLSLQNLLWAFSPTRGSTGIPLSQSSFPAGAGIANELSPTGAPPPPRHWARQACGRS